MALHWDTDTCMILHEVVQTSKRKLRKATRYEYYHRYKDTSVQYDYEEKSKRSMADVREELGHKPNKQVIKSTTDHVLVREKTVEVLRLRWVVDDLA